MRTAEKRIAARIAGQLTQPIVRYNAYISEQAQTAMSALFRMLTHNEVKLLEPGDEVWAKSTASPYLVRLTVARVKTYEAIRREDMTGAFKGLATDETQVDFKLNGDGTLTRTLVVHHWWEQTSVYTFVE
ncbi:MAG TPA: hypothetical protein VF077_06210 [Nitrospiraceae bacterium]